MDPLAGLPFYPIRSWVAKAGERLPFALHLKVKMEASGIQFIPYLDKGELVTPEKLEWLTKMGIDNLYLHTQDLHGALAYFNNRLMSLQADGPEQSREKLTILADHLNLSLRLAFTNACPEAVLGDTKKQVDCLVEEFTREETPLKLIWEILFRDYDLYKHCINVCLLGVGMMVFLRRSEAEIRSMGYAGLLHDIGMTRVSEEIVYRVGPLSAEEWRQVQEHPRLAWKILKDQVWMSQDSLRLILEHHENADGSGYPQGLTLERQHPLTRIIRVVDAYDAITSYRPYRTAQKPFTALRIMYDEMGLDGRIFDRQTLETFVRFQGFTISEQ